MTKLSELKELCEKATREFWVYKEPVSMLAVNPGIYLYECSDDKRYHRKDIHVIEKTAATDPETVLKLIETVEKMREALEKITLPEKDIGLGCYHESYAEQALEWAKEKWDG